MSSGFEVPNAPGDFDQFQAVDAVVLLRSLIRHLFVRFEMPQYWDSVWFQEGEIDYAQMEWFVHVASGQSLRKARGLPLVFTKQATHEMGQAPGGLTLFEAMRWGQLRAMGAGRELCRQILHTPAAGDFNNDASLCLPLFRLMIRDAECHAQVAGALVEYVGLRRLGQPDGERYRFQRKTMRALRREIANFYRAYPHATWERRVQVVETVRPRARKQRIYNWPAMSTVDSFDQVDSGSVRWRLFELRRSYLLESEGRHLGHCVGSYIGACLDGHSSIWSLRSFRGEAQRWEAMIDVHPNTRAIVEVRGYGNSKPSPDALEIVRAWAKRNRLTF